MNDCEGLDMKKKIFIGIYFTIMAIIIFGMNDLSKISTALEYVKCGSANGVPKPLVQMTTIAYTILIVGAPLVLIVFSILTVVKATSSGKDDEILSAKNKLLKKFTIAAVIFLMSSIVQFVIGRVTVNDTDKETMGSCLRCFLYYNSRDCEAASSSNDVETESYKNSYSNLSMPTASNRGEAPHGEIIDIDYAYNAKDSKGRCGKHSGDRCSVIATLTYRDGKKVKYYMGYQNNYGMKNGPCLTHAITSVINTIKGTTYSSLDVQNWQYNTSKIGKLVASNLNQLLDHYGVKGKVYAGEASEAEVAKIIRTELKAGRPVLLAMSSKKCPDMAGSAHAHVALFLDKNDHVWLIDSVNYLSKNGKRTPEELAKCVLEKNTTYNAAKWGQLITFE